MTHFMTGWCTDSVELVECHSLCSSHFNLHGQGKQTAVQGLPALYTADPKNTQRWSDFLFCITHLLQVSGQCWTGTNRNLPATRVSRHMMRWDVSTSISRERTHGSLGAELVSPAAAHWIWESSTGHTGNGNQGWVRQASLREDEQSCGC